MSLYQHFRRDEHPFVERVLEWTGRVRDRYEVIRTDFLDPRQAFIVRSLANREAGVYVAEFGGYEGAERVRIVLYPQYMEPTQEEFGVELLEVKGSNQFLTLEHRDYLGSLLGLGIKREKFGDILVHKEGAQLLVAEEIAEYVRLHMTQVHRIHVMVESKPLDKIDVPEQSFRTLSFTVQSPRLDAVIGDVYRLSRAKTIAPIQNGRAKVNFREVNDPSFQLEAGDVVSFKGFGRFKVNEIGGETKKGRIKMKVAVFD
ncbi:MULTISPECIES: RNA-binding protein [Aneurinibacillus]|jgi:RNA-binding protein YlmH|uniref:RNA-binding protein S4 n=1 Tax=Aneurinibacillus danicus TaxID=267746 RepID=A0A511V1D6_9BACL|nr:MULTISPECIES: YlmH/Sll1252 family protein [Aneurinibacillus]GEN32717.1 RNA-binding protein S4 [Aneurinibacillus danicus]